eukprot:6188173-Pleurochrysis_carterae.AAC.2
MEWPAVVSAGSPARRRPTGSLSLSAPSGVRPKARTQPRGASAAMGPRNEGVRAKVEYTPGSKMTCCTPRTIATVIRTTLNINDTRGQPDVGLAARCVALPLGSSTVRVAGCEASLGDPSQGDVLVQATSSCTADGGRASLSVV